MHFNAHQRVSRPPRGRFVHRPVQFLGRAIISLLVILVSFQLTGCRKPAAGGPVAETPAIDANAVAMVNGTAISRQALEDRLRRGGTRGLTATTALEELIRLEGTYQKAVTAGFDRRPEVQARIKSLVVAQFREAQARLTNAPPVTAAELQTAYETQKDKFRTPEAVRGAAILLDLPRTLAAGKRAEFRLRAEALLAEARQAVDDAAFAQLVARHSTDPSTRYRGGDTGWLRREDRGSGSDPELVEALLQLSRPGEFAPLVESARGFYIVKLTEKRAASHKPLTEVEEAIRYQLQRQKAEQAEREFQATMKSGLDIQINQPLLKSIAVMPSPDVPPALPGSTTAQVR